MGEGILDILDENEVVSSEQRLKTKMAIDNHPVLSEPDCNKKKAYFTLVCGISIADKQLLPIEKSLLEDLALSINLEAGYSEEVMSILHGDDKAKKNALLQGAITTTKASKFLYNCLYDMFEIAACDDNWDDNEDKLIHNMMCNHLGISKEKISGLRLFFDSCNSFKRSSRQDLENILNKADIDKQYFNHILNNLTYGDSKTNRPKTEVSTVDMKPFEKKVSKEKKELLSTLTYSKASLTKFITNVEKRSPDSELVNKAKEYCRVLDIEGEQISELRLTIPFVGTMKSGKTTTINAIIGAKVLPSRAEAMTTLPTVVTHCDGQQTPVLRLKKHESFNDALKVLKKRITTKYASTNKGEPYFKTLQRIAEGELKEIKPEYTGIDEIHIVLENINDIVRICEQFDDIEDPLMSYSDLTDFPEILVEFAYVRGRIKNAIGTLSFVDTPGPNEAKQGNLKGVVKSALKSASSMVCVVDATQKDSEAQDELGSWVIAAAREGVPLYVLMNKIDQLADSDLQDLSRFDMIAQKLFSNKDFNFKPENRVFPINSLRALHSNLAMNAIDYNKQLPDTDWAKAFVKDMFGSRASINDCCNKITEIKECCDHSWVESRFDAPMNNLVLSSLQKAAPLCMQNVTLKVKGINRQLFELFDASIKQNSRSASELEKTCKKLKDILANVDSSVEKCSKSISQFINKITKDLQTNINKTIKDTESNFEKIVNSEKNKQKKNAEKERASNRSTLGFFADVGQYLLNSKGNQSIRDALSSDEKMEFSNAEEATEFVNSLTNFVKKIGKDYERGLSEGTGLQVNEGVQDLTQEINGIIKNVVDEAALELKNEFNCEVIFPQLSVPQIEFDIDVAESNIIKRNTSTRTVKTGSWLKPWTWGSTREVIDETFIVNPSTVRKHIVGNLEISLERAGRFLIQNIEESFTGEKEIFIEVITGKMQAIIKATEDSINIKKKDAKLQDSLVASYADTITELQDVSDRYEQTIKAIEKILA